MLRKSEARSNLPPQQAPTRTKSQEASIWFQNQAIKTLSSLTMARGSATKETSRNSFITELGNSRLIKARRRLPTKVTLMCHRHLSTCLRSNYSTDKKKEEKTQSRQTIPTNDRPITNTTDLRTKLATIREIP